MTIGGGGDHHGKWHNSNAWNGWVNWYSIGTIDLLNQPTIVPLTYSTNNYIVGCFSVVDPANLKHQFFQGIPWETNRPQPSWSFEHDPTTIECLVNIPWMAMVCLCWTCYDCPLVMENPWVQRWYFWIFSLPMGKTKIPPYLGCFFFSGWLWMYRRCHNFPRVFSTQEIHHPKKLIYQFH